MSSHYNAQRFVTWEAHFTTTAREAWELLLVLEEGAEHAGS